MGADDYADALREGIRGVIVGRQRQYHGILNIPEGKLGDFEIKHEHKPAGAEFRLASARTMIMGGDAGGVVRYASPTRWHMLLENGGVWMSDIPIEQAQHDEVLKRIRSGSVLIGGLGLGYAATILAQRPRISRVTVVERSDNVIGLVWKHLLKDKPETRRKLTIVHADLFEYLQAQPKRPAFTNAFYDIWQSDGEGTFFKVVVPLLRLSHEIVKNRPICWNENVMRGQLYFGLSSRAFLHGKTGGMQTLEECATPAGNIWHDWAVPFFQWMLNAKPDAKLLDEAVKRYVASYGVPIRERFWDAGLREEAPARAPQPQGS
jgi:hypothetical protein